MPVRWMLLIAGLSFSLPVTAEDWNADEKAVWKLEEDYWRFVSAGDVDAYVSLWHDDFVGWPCFEWNPARKGDNLIHVWAYTLDGQPLSSRHSTGMVAATAVGGLAATVGANERAFVEELWRTPIPVGEQRYFDGMLYVMSLLHCSGNFKIWGAK